MRNRMLQAGLAAGMFTTMLSCNNGGQMAGGTNTPIATSVQTQPKVIPGRRSLCFLQVSGHNNRDSLRVSLSFRGDQVTGEMEQTIFEKDRRHGKLSGLLLQQDITATWTYMQEGLTDSLEVDFRMGNDGLLQRPFSVDPQTGRQYTDKQAPFSMKIPEVPCR